jgi:hypothetical protein
MTGSAWWMLGVTWGVILFFTTRFFYKVLTLPQRRETEPAGSGEDRPHS